MEHFFSLKPLNEDPKAKVHGFQLTRLEELLSKGQNTSGVDLFTVHRAEKYMVHYVDKGAGKHTVDLHEYPMHPGAFLFIGPRQILRYDPSRSYGGFLIEFSEDFLFAGDTPVNKRSIAHLFDHHDGTSTLDARRNRELITFFELVLKEYQHCNDALRPDILRSSLSLLLLHASRLLAQQSLETVNTNSGYQHYQSFRKHLSEQVGGSRNASDFAKEIGITYKYLNDLCKLYSGSTAKDIIDGERIAEAQRLLVRDQLSVREAARLVGFTDVSNFRKYFKKFTGQTPREFRGKHQV